MHKKLILFVNKAHIFFFIFTIYLSKLYSYSYETISKAPLTFAYSLIKENSNLTKTLLYAGERSRYSSCSGLVWMPGDQYLISVHLFSGTITTYEFDKEILSLNPLKCYGKTEGFFLNHPENLSIDPVSEWGVISQGSGTLNFFKLDPKTGNIYPSRMILQHKKNDWVHGVTYSKNGRFIACTSIGDNPKICIYKRENKKFQIHQVLETKIRPLEPKAVAFSHDGKFLAACYCQIIGKNVCKNPKATIQIYRFDPNSELFDPNPISSFTKNPGNMESVTFSPDDSFLLTTDQVFDEVFVHNFDRISGSLISSKVLLENPEAELNFPHGLSFSNDGKYIGVTNYGDDRITIYQFDP